MEWLIDIIKEWVLSKAYATEAWVLGKNYQSAADLPEWTTPLSITGVLDPDATSTYLKAGTYNDKPYYRRLDGAYFVWWRVVGLWVISVELGSWAGRLWTMADPEITGDYNPIPPATGIATVSEDYNYLKTSFVDRGDPAAYDFSHATFTIDNAWHDWDLSSVIPAGAKGVVFFFWFANTNVSIDIQLRRKGNVNTKNISNLRTLVASIFRGAEPIVPLDSNRKIQYKIDNIGVWSIAGCIKGWWF